MAEIPVERKSGGGIPWWVWLLGALLLLALLGLLSRGCNDANTTANVNGNANAAVTTANINTNAVNGNANSRITTEGVGTATGARVTDVDIFGSTADKASLVGRQVELSNVRVTRVLSDRLFTVTSGSGEMFAMLAGRLDNAGGNEQRIGVRQGEMLNLSGEFRRVPAAADLAREQRTGLTPAETEALRDQQVHLHVTRIDEVR